MRDAEVGLVKALVVAVAAALAGGSALAAPAAPPRADRWQAIVECRRETNDKSRLACMDAAIAAAEAAEANRELVIVDRKRAEAEDRSRFGLTGGETLAQAVTKPLKPARIRNYDSTVLRAFQSSYLKEWIFWLADGSVWRQHGDDEIYREPKQGSTVSISRGALGTFFLVVDRGFAVRVRRIR